MKKRNRIQKDYHQARLLEEKQVLEKKEKKEDAKTKRERGKPSKNKRANVDITMESTLGVKRPIDKKCRVDKARARRVKRSAKRNPGAMTN